MIGFSESSKCAQICKVSDILYITFRVSYSIVNTNIWKDLFETLSHLVLLCYSALFFFSLSLSLSLSLHFVGISGFWV
jgi:hypothetical protein